MRWSKVKVVVLLVAAAISAIIATGMFVENVPTWLWGASVAIAYGVLSNLLFVVIMKIAGIARKFYTHIRRRV